MSMYLINSIRSKILTTERYVAVSALGLACRKEVDRVWTAEKERGCKWSEEDLSVLIRKKNQQNCRQNKSHFFGMS